MGRCLAAALGLVLVGCLGASPTREPRMFVLDAIEPEARAPKLDVSIGVGPVSIPKRLDRPQILTRTADHEVRLAKFDQWAEPLDQSFARAVAENLARSLPTDRVAVYPWNRSADIDWKVEIDVSHFERDADGSVTLAVRWRLIDNQKQGPLHHGAATFREVPELSTTDSLVAAMSRLVAALSASIGATIPSTAHAGVDR
jgi:uncharacterized lipoprotein YmbA